MKRILIVEDDTVIAEVEKDYLESAGFRVDIAVSGDDGLALALRENYALILLDIMLPGVDGFAICRQVRKAKPVPILMISARTEDVDKIRGFGLGADDYIVKPFSVGELVARVKAHLARYERLTQGGYAPQANDQLQTGGLVIDKPSRKVYAGGREILLKTKEYDLLLFLASHPGRVFRKDELFERIWGQDSLGDLATLTVHISRLREKIERIPSKPERIETIWSVGYRFNA